MGVAFPSVYLSVYDAIELRVNSHVAADHLHSQMKY